MHGVRPPELPIRLGRFLLTERLGAGGAATVYRAKVVEGPASGHVAVKMMHPHLADAPEAVFAFRHEARLLDRLEHRGIVRLIEQGEHKGVPYLVTELLEGATLAQLLNHLEGARGPRPIDSMVYAVCEIAEALHHAHETSDEEGQRLQLVHRDVSPDNIFVTNEGRVCLLDFGIARTQNTTSITQTGHVKGKISYMAPEQLAAQPVDQRADVFSLAVVLYEALSGKRLFARANAVLTAVAVQSDPVTPLDQVDDKISHGLSALVDLALARDRSRRFSSSEAFAVALRSTLAGREEMCTRTLVALVTQVKASVPWPGSEGSSALASGHDDHSETLLDLQLDDTTAPGTPKRAVATDPVINAAPFRASTDELDMGDGGASGLDLDQDRTKQMKPVPVPELEFRDQTRRIAPTGASPTAIIPGLIELMPLAVAVEPQTADEPPPTKPPRSFTRPLLLLLLLGAAATFYQFGWPLLEQRIQDQVFLDRATPDGTPSSRPPPKRAPLSPAEAVRTAQRLANEAASLCEAGQNERCVRLLERCLALAELAECHLRLGKEQLAHGEAKLGRFHLKRYLTLVPDAPDVAEIKALVESEPAPP